MDRTAGGQPAIYRWRSRAFRIMYHQSGHLAGLVCWIEVPD